jgi:hypothetical protein
MLENQSSSDEISNDLAGAQRIKTKTLQPLDWEEVRRSDGYAYGIRSRGASHQLQSRPVKNQRAESIDLDPMMAFTTLLHDMGN